MRKQLRIAGETRKSIVFPLTTLGNNPQSISKISATGTTDFVYRRDLHYYLCKISRTHRRLTAAKVAVWSLRDSSICEQRQKPSIEIDDCVIALQVLILNRSTYHNIKYTNSISGMRTDQTATAIICSRRFRGIFDGTKLYFENAHPPIDQLAYLCNKRR